VNGAIGWARRSGNQRLTGFAIAIGARAHARLGETDLCLDLLDEAGAQLERHDPDAHRWLSVFDRAALDGRRGCHACSTWTNPAGPWHRWPPMNAPHRTSSSATA